MAITRMTLALPTELAQQLVSRVPVRDRSRFIAEALKKSLREQEALVRSCRLANRDRDAKAIEEEWDQIRGGIESL